MWGVWMLYGLLSLHPGPAAPDVQFWAPPQCPDRAALLASATEYAPGTSGPGVVAGGYIRRDQGQYLLEFSITTPSGTTKVELEHASCEVLVDAAAVKLGLALEQARPASEPPASPGHDDEKPLARPTVSERPPLRRRPRVELSAAGGVDWGTVPGFGPVLSGGVSLLRWPRARARLYAVHLPAREVWRREAPGEGAAFSSLGAGAAVCYVWRAYPVLMPWCGGVELAALRWRGLGATRAFGGRAVVPSVAAQTGLRWPAEGPVGVSVTADLIVPLVRYEVDLHDTPLKYRTRAVAVRTWLGFVVRL